MKTTTKWRTGRQILLATSLCGSVFQIGSCLSALARNFNPCGTILTCDPAEFDLLTIDPLEPDYDFNPTCVIPGLFNCTPPISVGGATSSTDTTTTSGLTSTTTTTSTNRTNTTGTRGQLQSGFF